jgi:hypothetical protein
MIRQGFSGPQLSISSSRASNPTEIAARHASIAAIFPGHGREKQTTKRTDHELQTPDIFTS